MSQIKYNKIYNKIKIFFQYAYFHYWNEKKKSPNIFDVIKWAPPLQKKKKKGMENITYLSRIVKSAWGSYQLKNAGQAFWPIPLN